MQEPEHVVGADGIQKSVEGFLHAEHDIPYRLLVVGTEVALFEKHSPVRDRILASFGRFATVDFIVLCGPGFKRTTVGPTVTVHPTNSRYALLRVFDAIRIGRSLSRPHIVTVQDPFESGIAGMRIARAHAAKLHVQIHTDLFASAFAALSLQNRIRVALAQIVLRRASRIRVVSERIKRSLEGRVRLGTPISVLPVFVDIARYRESVAPESLKLRFSRYETKLLVASRLEKEKNVRLAIVSFAAAAPQSACLIILGSGRERDALKRLAQELRVSDRVFFEGHRDVAPYLALADLVLSVSRYEGYGLAIVEALARGVPVLSTDVGVAKEAGAIIAEEHTYVEAVKEWFVAGPREGKLASYPYQNFKEYILKYCDDIASAAQ